MFHPRRLALTVAALVGLVANPGTAAADPVIAFSFTSGGTHTFQGNSFTAGYTFTTTQDIVVSALGVWDRTPATPLALDHEVAIWDSGGTLLASTTVLTNNPLTLDFRFAALGSPLTLLTAETYTIGAFYPNTGANAGLDQPLRSSATGFATAPGVTFGTNQFIFGATLTRPISGFPPIDPADFGPNFLFEPAAVPEPAMLLLVGAGLLGVARKRRRQNRA